MKARRARATSSWPTGELNYLPSNITFLTTMSRYYYEQQTRSEIDENFQLPVSVSKNFRGTVSST